jgi:hypothetical protein
MTEKTLPETFEEFKNSFSYGSRSDMNFKFLKALSEDDAGDFFQGLLWKLGDASNDGNYEPVFNHIFDWQVKAYSAKTKWEYSDAPFIPLRKPLSESKIGLLTTSGHFVEGDDPEPFGVKDMGLEEAQKRISEFLKVEPVLSTIPLNTPRENIRLRHGGYDNRAALADFNSVLPLDRLEELQESGTIGQIMENAYSFVGACAQNPLINETAPKWAEMFKSQGVDGMILVPV